LGFAALMLVFAASRRNSAENTELFQSNAKTISALEQRLEDLQQTVSRQSRLINQLRADPLGQARAELMQAPFDSEDLWVTLEPFVEQHL
jgi:predicted ribosome quality control (RQC) complex YloA/Tae2 family protein